MKNYSRPIFAAIVLIALSRSASAQNIFPQKLSGCDIPRFCLDCGDPKADAGPGALEAITKDLNKSYKFGKAPIGVMFQVLVDSLGQGCVLSHTDRSNNLLTRGIIGYLNTAKWTPAIVEGKPAMASINVVFRAADGKIAGQVQRIKPGDVVFK